MGKAGARRMGIAAAALVAAVGVLAIAILVHARIPLRGRTFVDGAVRFAVPRTWEVQRLVAGATTEGVALYLPCAPLDRTPHSANANLLAEPNADGEDLASWSERRLAAAAPRRIVEERLEPGWRTVVSHGEDRGARYVIVERFGISARARVHAVAAFPCLARMDPGWFHRAAEDIDRFLASVALEGAMRPAVRVEWDGRSLRLRGPAAPALASGG